MVADLCSVCRQFEQRVATGSVGDPSGGVAQLVERLHGMQEVRGFESHRLHALRGQAATERDASTFAGSVAGESSFIVTRELPALANGDPRLRFVTPSPPTRQPPFPSPSDISFPAPSATSSRRGGRRWRPLTPNTPTASARVPRAAPSPAATDLFEAAASAGPTTTVPPATDVASFVGGFVAAEGSFTISGEPSSFSFGEHHAKRVRPCTIEGCERSRRAKGLCRSHYYDAYRR